MSDNPEEYINLPESNAKQNMSQLDLKQLCLKNNEAISILKGELKKFSEVEYELKNLKIEYQKLTLDNKTLSLRLQEQNKELIDLTKENKELKINSKDTEVSISTLPEHPIRKFNTIKENSEVVKLADTIKYLTEENSKLKEKCDANNLEILKEREKVKALIEENEKIITDFKVKNEIINNEFYEQIMKDTHDNTYIDEIKKRKDVMNSLTNEANFLRERFSEYKEVEDKLEKYKEKIKSLTDKNEKLKKKLKEKDEEIQDINKRDKSKIKELAEENNNLKDSELQRKAQIKKYEEEIEDLTKANRELKRKNREESNSFPREDEDSSYKSTEKIKELMEDNEKLRLKVKMNEEELEEKAKSYKKELATLIEENEKVKNNLHKDQSDKLGKLQQNVKDLSEENEMLKSQLRKKEDEYNENVKKYKNNANEMDEEILKLKEKAKKGEEENNNLIQKLNSKINSLTEEVETLMKKSKEADILSDQLEVYRKKVKDLTEENERLTKEVLELKMSITQLKGLIMEAESREILVNKERMRQEMEDKSIKEELKKANEALTIKLQAIELAKHLLRNTSTHSNNIISINIPIKKQPVIDIEEPKQIYKSKCSTSEGVLNLSLMYRKERIDYLVNVGVLDLLIRILKNATEEYPRTEVIRFLYTIAYQFPESTKELVNRQIPYYFTEEAIKETEGIQSISDFTVDVLNGIKAILDNCELASQEFVKKSFVKCLLLSLNFGKRVVRVLVMKCICLLYKKVKKLEHEDDLWVLLLTLWDRAEESNDNTLAVLCLSALSYCIDGDEKRETLKKLKLIIPTLLKYIKGSSLDLDTEFFDTHCRVRLIYLVKCLSIDEEQRTIFIKEGVINVLESMKVSDCKEVREISIEVLELYQSGFKDVKLERVIPVVKYEESIVPQVVTLTKQIEDKPLMVNLIDNSNVSSDRRVKGVEELNIKDIEITRTTNKTQEAPNTSVSRLDVPTTEEVVNAEMIVKELIEDNKELSKSENKVEETIVQDVVQEAVLKQKDPEPNNPEVKEIKEKVDTQEKVRDEVKVQEDVKQKKVNSIPSNLEEKKLEQIKEENKEILVERKMEKLQSLEESALEKKKSEISEQIERTEEAIVKIITQMDNKDEKIVIKSVKYLIEIAKDSNFWLPIINNNGLTKLLKLLTNPNSNLALLASNLVIALLQEKKGQKQFYDCKGLQIILPFIVFLPFLTNRKVMIVN